MNETEFIELLRKIGDCEDKEQMARCVDKFNSSNGEPDNKKWIPVTERLPESGVKVLISCREYDEPAIGWYESDPEYSVWYGEHDLSQRRDLFVTHWMPLPELPKGE